MCVYVACILVQNMLRLHQMDTVTASELRNMQEVLLSKETEVVQSESTAKGLTTGQYLPLPQPNKHRVRGDVKGCRSCNTQWVRTKWSCWFCSSPSRVTASAAGPGEGATAGGKDNMWAHHPEGADQHHGVRCAHLQRPGHPEAHSWGKEEGTTDELLLTFYSVLN